MSIKSAPYYWLECDGCGKRCEYDEFAAVADKDEAVEQATESYDWTTDGQRHHCPSCPSLFRCEECGDPAGDPDDPNDLCGERDYHCKTCWRKAAADAETAEEIHAL